MLLFLGVVANTSWKCCWYCCGCCRHRLKMLSLLWKQNEGVTITVILSLRTETGGGSFHSYFSSTNNTWPRFEPDLQYSSTWCMQGVQSQINKRQSTETSVQYHNIRLYIMQRARGLELSAIITNPLQQRQLQSGQTTALLKHGALRYCCCMFWLEYKRKGIRVQMERSYLCS